MHETLRYLTTVTDPANGLWVLAAPVEGGAVQALSPKIAIVGADEGWLEGLPTTLRWVVEGAEQARQTQPEA
jgi:hypothetical protein